MADESIVRVLGDNPEKEIDRLLEKLDLVIAKQKEINEGGKSSAGNGTLSSAVNGQGQLVKMTQAAADALTQQNAIIEQAISLKARLNGSTKEVATIAVKLAIAEREEAKAILEVAKADTETSKQRLNNAKAYTAELKSQQAERKKISDDDRELNRLIKEEEKANAAQIKEAKKQAAKEAAAYNKQVKDEERELNRLIAIEEKALGAQTKAEAREVSNARKQADRDYQQTWKALLEERDAGERNAALQRKKEAAAAVSRVAIDSNIAMSRTLNDLRAALTGLPRQSGRMSISGAY